MRLVTSFQWCDDLFLRSLFVYVMPFLIVAFPFSEKWHDLAHLDSLACQARVNCPEIDSNSDSCPPRDFA